MLNLAIKRVKNIITCFYKTKMILLFKNVIINHISDMPGVF